jgi:hypothetical protein
LLRFARALEEPAMGPKVRRLLGVWSIALIAAAGEAGCSTAVSGPDLVVTGVSPNVFCKVSLPQTVSLIGEGFFTLPVDSLGESKLLVPSVELVPVATHGGAPTGAAKRVPDEQVRFVSDHELKVSLTADVVPADVFDFRVTNPDGQSATLGGGTLVTMPAATIDGFAKESDKLTCATGMPQERTVLGKNLVRSGGTPPAVRVDDKVVEVKSMGGCQPDAHQKGVELCTSITFVVPGDLPAGEHQVHVANQSTDCAASSGGGTVRFYVAAPPAVTLLFPGAVCAGGGGGLDLTLEGTGLLKVDAAQPAIAIDGMNVTITKLDQCTAVGKDLLTGVSICTRATVSVPAALLTVGAHKISVTNPEPAPCTGMAAYPLAVSPVPSVTSASSGSVCGGGATITVTGKDFYAFGTTVPVVELVPKMGGSPVAAAQVTCTDCGANGLGTTLDAKFLTGGNAGTQYDIVVTNPGGCVAPAPHPSITALDSPKLFLVDPFVVPSIINARVTVYATSLVQPVQSVSIVPANMNMPVTKLTVLPADPKFPNRAQAIVPKNTPAGKYDVYLLDSSGCPAAPLPGGLTITDQLTITLKGVLPPFGAALEETAITVTRDTAALAPKDKPFVATPRIYLSPALSTNPPDTAPSVLLGATAFITSDRLSSVVRPGAAPQGLYDVIVVNPTGEIGVLFDGYKSTQNPPPRIDDVVPPSLVAATGQNLVVSGDDFRAGATVSLSCVNTAKQPVAPPPVTAVGAPSCDAKGKNCTMTTTVNAGSLQAGFVCLLRVTNTDATFADFSALGVTTPSLNLASPTVGTDMLVARRALVAASGKPTDAARFLYAIGGDDGVPNSHFTSVESAPIDLFGAMGVWTMQKQSLGTARAFAGVAQTRRYIYVVGGRSNANTPLNTVERAQILDPREAPDIVDVNFTFDALGVGGIEPGDYVYMVSAAFSATDPHNPSGEGLASDPFAVKLPQGASLGVTITWLPARGCNDQPLPNVSAYRIYRTAKANGGPGTEVLLATVPGNQLSYTDDGSAMPGSEKPNVIGATGVWKALPPMAEARSGVAATIAVDPTNAKTKKYLYAIFGQKDATTVLGSYQYLPIDEDVCHFESEAAAWVNGTATGTARASHMIWRVDRAIKAAVGQAPNVPDTNLIYVGGGMNALGGPVNTVLRAKVQAGGQLDAFADSGKSLPGSGEIGSGVMAAAEQIFFFGGAGGGPSKTGRSATITDGAGTLANNSWNAGLDLLGNGRVYMGSTVQSAFGFFLGGGVVTANDAVKTTEQVVW